jgi:hypothetical protein
MRDQLNGPRRVDSRGQSALGAQRAIRVRSTSSRTSNSIRVKVHRDELPSDSWTLPSALAQGFISHSGIGALVFGRMTSGQWVARGR